jgi:hypothetical protein
MRLTLELAFRMQALEDAGKGDRDKSAHIGRVMDLLERLRAEVDMRPGVHDPAAVVEVSDTVPTCDVEPGAEFRGTPRSSSEGTPPDRRMLLAFADLLRVGRIGEQNREPRVAR